MPEDQLKEDGGYDSECPKPPADQSDQIFQRRGNSHIPGQHSQTWWKSKQGHQEPLSERHQCSQNAQLCMKVPAVEHQDQAKTISQLCPIHLNMWLRMLENDRRRSLQIVSLPQSP